MTIADIGWIGEIMVVRPVQKRIPECRLGFHVPAEIVRGWFGSNFFI